MTTLLRVDWAWLAWAVQGTQSPGGLPSHLEVRATTVARKPRGAAADLSCFQCALLGHVSPAGLSLTLTGADKFVCRTWLLSAQAIFELGLAP